VIGCEIVVVGFAVVVIVDAADIVVEVIAKVKQTTFFSTYTMAVTYATKYILGC